MGSDAFVSSSVASFSQSSTILYVLCAIIKDRKAFREVQLTPIELAVYLKLLSIFLSWKQDFTPGYICGNLKDSSQSHFPK